MDTVTIHPMAGAQHYQRGHDFWQNEAMLLRHQLVIAQEERAQLEQQFEELRARVAVLEEEASSTEAAPPDPA